MDLKEFPVLDTLEFEAVTVDATKWPNDTYSLMLTFWKVFPKTAEDKREPEGMILCTHMGGETLREAYQKFELLFSSGFLSGVSVYPNGFLWDGDNGDMISEISWQDLEDFDQEDEEFESLEIDRHKSPTLLQ